MRVGILALVAVAGCGRFGYDSHGADCSGAGCEADAGAADALASGDGAGAADAGGPDGAVAAVTLTPAADSAINSFAPDLNYGGSPAFNVRTGMMSTFVGLLRFDIPAGGTAVAARLRLTTTATALSQGEVAVYEVLEPWDEGVEVGAAGVANWNQRATGTSWAAAGCGPGSRSATALARFAPTATGTTYEIDLPVAAVQAWLEDPATHRGLALVAEGTALADVVGFWSRENTSGQAELVVDRLP